MVLTCTFWALFFLPGYAWILRYARPLRAAGFLASLAYSYVASFVMLSPISLLCYAAGAPLWVFSGALALLVLAACLELVRTRGAHELAKELRAEPIAPYLLLGLLLCLQLRVGGWLDGDATFHLGRMRVLLEHGFTNRDIYLSEYHFQHIYHSNLLYPVYASLAQLTRQSYLTGWFYSEAWAKLLVAAGHYVLGATLTQRRYAGFLLAICMITLNAGETYALYPNTLCVGFLLPILLAQGFECLAPARPSRGGVGWMAAFAFVLAQVHALYAVYAGLVLGPILLLAVLRPRADGQRWLRVLALLSLGAALPFVLVSSFGFRAERELSSAPESDQLPPPPAALRTGIVNNADPRVFMNPAVAAGGGHLEKMLFSPADDVFVFLPEHIGGARFVRLGFAALVFAWLVSRGRRWPLFGALLAAALLAGLLFSERGAGWAMLLLKSTFVVARLSTVLTTLLVFGCCASLAWLVERIRRGQRLCEWLALGLAFAVSTQLLGHAPVSFAEHVRSALQTRADRHAALRRLLDRRKLLRKLPHGVTVLTTARFARQVVALRDCYVLAADRGHTQVGGIDKRRRDLVFLNAENTPWSARERLIRHYDLHWVTFESRWRRRYQWAYLHGRVRATGAGQDLIELD